MLLSCCNIVVMSWLVTPPSPAPLVAHSVLALSVHASKVYHQAAGVVLASMCNSCA